MFKITTSFKRMALMMVLAISGTISVLAGNRLVLNDGGPIAIKPGETKEITVNLVNDEVIYAMQFDMDFTSPNVEIVPGSFKINEDRIDRECFIATMIQQPDMKWRIALLTKDFTPIAGTEAHWVRSKFVLRPTSLLLMMHRFCSPLAVEATARARRCLSTAPTIRLSRRWWEVFARASRRSLSSLAVPTRWTLC